MRRLDHLVTSVIHHLANAWRRPFLRIASEGPHRLEIESNRGHFVFDARRRVVSKNGRQVLRFEQIKFIDLTCEQELLHHSTWQIDLYIHVLRRVRIGQCRDEVLVSTLGAKLGELTGVKRLAWKESHGIRR